MAEQSYPQFRRDTQQNLANLALFACLLAFIGVLGFGLYAIWHVEKAGPGEAMNVTESD